MHNNFGYLATVSSYITILADSVINDQISSGCMRTVVVVWVCGSLECCIVPMWLVHVAVCSLSLLQMVCWWSQWERWARLPPHPQPALGRGLVESQAPFCQSHLHNRNPPARKPRHHQVKWVGDMGLGVGIMNKAMTCRMYCTGHALYTSTGIPSWFNFAALLLPSAALLLWGLHTHCMTVLLV